MKKTTYYEKEFIFFKKCLDYHKISYHSYTFDKESSFEDLGIRHALGFSPEASQNLIHLFLDSLEEDTLCYLTDELSCHYIAFILPNTTPQKVFIIGPYISASEKDTVLEFMNQQTTPATWLPILKNYYFQICTMTNDDTLNSLVYTLAEYLWGKDHFTTHYVANGLADSFTTLVLPSDPQRRLDLFSNIELVENMYSSENELANAISHGQTARARAIFSNLPLNGFKYETEPLRNLKNFSIIINTIFRKSAERGGVHPIYIDQLSNSFMTRIEELNRTDNIFDLWTDMLQRYCTLVNNHNTRSYSLPIQKIITRINFDITADLSLKTMAEFLNINASYLSNLFKKETGYTLTNYVNKKRMEHAAFLLSTTALSISTIAQQCGILDDNYFTKLFKRYYDMTPSQFRDALSNSVPT